MKNVLLTTILGLAVISFAGCKGGEKVDSKAKNNTSSSATTQSYTKADYMKACKTGMTDAQCNCFVDFYDSIGLKITELGDTAKVQAAVQKLKPEQTMKMAKCMQ